MKEKPNYYSVIPAEIRYDNDLKDKAKLLYGEIAALSNITGECFATNKYFSELFNVSTTTISLLIKNLVDKGYIESEIKYKKNTKEIEGRYLRIVKGGYLRNLKGGIKEKLKDNNTSINNNKLNEFNLYNNFHQNERCECITKNTNERCSRKSSFNINGKNYCNQHARELIPDIDIKPKKEKYGVYGRVKLTVDEYLRLVNEFGEDFIKKQIDLLDEYLESNNNKNRYTNFNLVLRKSIRENWFKQKKEGNSNNVFLDIMKDDYGR